MKPGGFSKFRAVDENDKITLDKALNGLKGVGYEPFAVSSQIVQGFNYKFLCNATATTNPSTEYTALVIVYRPLNGDPILIHTKKTDL